MTHRFNLFLVALVSFGLLDGLWLGALMGACRRTQISLITRMSGNRLAPLWAPALLVYVLLAFGIVVFVLPTPPGDAPVVKGLLFGFIVYSVYDLSHLTGLKGWLIMVTALDVAWGATATAATTW